jgi:hypothetical protein
MKINSISKKKKKKKKFTTSILKCSQKKNQILTKTFHQFSSTWTLFFKLPQILGPIQIFANKNLKT